MSKKPKTERSARRAAERAREKLGLQRTRLARLDAGGAPDRPIEVASASLVEVRAEAEPCLYCDEPVRTVEHRAEVIDERRLRVAVVRCGHCGRERIVYFRIGTVLAS